MVRYDRRVGLNVNGILSMEIKQRMLKVQYSGCMLYGEQCCLDMIHEPWRKMCTLECQCSYVVVKIIIDCRSRGVNIKLMENIKHELHNL